MYSSKILLASFKAASFSNSRVLYYLAAYIIPGSAAIIFSISLTKSLEMINKTIKASLPLKF